MNAAAPDLFAHAKRLEACRKLEAIVARTRNSYEVRRFREKRQAALRHTPTLWLSPAQIISPAQPTPSERN